MTSVAQPPRGEAAWQAYRELITRLDVQRVRQLRRDIVDRVIAARPDLEEIGGSDINCYGVTFIECGDLVATPDGYAWPNEEQEPDLSQQSEPGRAL